MAVLTVPSFAQVDKKPYLEQLIEDTLASPNFNVTITGMQGTFSSDAKIERIEISDADGKWLDIEGAALSWTRSALLRGRVEVQTLAADKITVLRTPASEETTIESGSFRIPELPVSIEIENLSATELHLLEPVLGQPASLRADGRITLIDGDVDVSLLAEHLDKSGKFELNTIYNGLAQTISLDLDAQENANGLVAQLLNIPNAPALALTLNGEGPQDNFTTGLSLATDGVERINGQFVASPLRIDGQEDGLSLRFDTIGNLAPLFQEEYRPFFGERATLKGLIERRADGSTSLPEFNLVTATLAAQGRLELAPDYTPSNIELRARLADAQGAPIVLPISGAKTIVQSGTVSIAYSNEQPWSGEITATGLSRDGLSVALSKISGGGKIAPAFLQKSPSDLLLSADVDVTLDGIKHTDSNLARAMGERVSGSANIVWNKDQPITFSNLSVSNGNFRASVEGDIAGLETALLTQGDIVASIKDLSAFAGLIGQPVNGNTEITATGQTALLTGEFDLELDITGNNLSLNNPSVDRFIAGRNTFSMSAKRTEGGIRFENLKIVNPQLSGEASGQLSSDDLSASLSARLNNARIISETLTGPLTLTGSASQSGDDILVDLQTVGIGGLSAAISGRVPKGSGAWDIRATGNAPLALLDRNLAANSAKVRGNANFDVSINGQPSLDALSGQVTTTGASFVFPSQQITLSDIQSTTNISNGTAQTQMQANLGQGGSVSLNGRIELNQSQGFPVDLDINVNNARKKDRNFYSTVLNGTLNLTGPALNGPTLSGQVALSDTEVNLKAQLIPTLSFLPEIAHVNEPNLSFQTRQRAGLVRAQTDDTTSVAPIKLNIVLSAPSRVFVRGRGLDAELGGRIRFMGTTQNVVPTGAFNLIRGRMDILGKRFNLSEASMTMIGSLDPRIRVVATTTSSDFTTSVIVSGLVSDPQISLESTPELPEDEILSHMIFGKNLNEISPFQAIQLASGLRELSGKGGIAFASKLRSKLDLDDFNVVVDDDGDIGVRAGKYLSENVYTTVTIAERDKSTVSINLDVNKNVTLRGSVKETGASSVGVFFEKDY
ncbi:translocation/assembly module TamB domain-containing protein [Paramylibacter ulvae]|nr:translocation/assembly module TamB domain-containing protein [Amylibacter ulvae]